jgi:hypothetical protein
MKINGYEFNVHTAAKLVTGIVTPQSHDQYLAAWQYLVATSWAWKLKGWFGWRAFQLIEENRIYSREKFLERYLDDLEHAETLTRRPTRAEAKEAINDICN